MPLKVFNDATHEQDLCGISKKKKLQAFSSEREARWAISLRYNRI